MSALPFAIKRDVERWTYRVYVTDALQIIAENTAIPAAEFTAGKEGKTLSVRWSDLRRQQKPEENRTAEEIIAHIRKKLEEV